MAGQGTLPSGTGHVTGHKRRLQCLPRLTPLPSQTRSLYKLRYTCNHWLMEILSDVTVFYLFVFLKIFIMAKNIRTTNLVFFLRTTLCTEPTLNFWRELMLHRTAGWQACTRSMRQWPWEIIWGGLAAGRKLACHITIVWVVSDLSVGRRSLWDYSALGCHHMSWDCWRRDKQTLRTVNIASCVFVEIYS